MTNDELVKAFFEGNTGRTHNSCVTDQGVFINYTTNIAYRDNGNVYLNNFKYSHTTSRIQNAIEWGAVSKGLKLITVSPENLNRIISGKKPSKRLSKQEQNLKNQIERYASKYYELLRTKKLDYEGRAGDCFHCQFNVILGGKEHLLSHIEEQYYPFSLIQLLQLSHRDLSAIHSYYNGNSDQLGSMRTFKTKLIRYFEEQLMGVKYENCWLEG